MFLPPLYARGGIPATCVIARCNDKQREKKSGFVSRVGRAYSSTSRSACMRTCRASPYALQFECSISNTPQHPGLLRVIDPLYTSYHFGTRSFRRAEHRRVFKHFRNITWYCITPLKYLRAARGVTDVLAAMVLRFLFTASQSDRGYERPGSNVCASAPDGCARKGRRLQRGGSRREHPSSGWTAKSKTSESTPCRP